MRSTSALLLGVAAAALIALTPHAASAQGKAQDTVTVGATDLGGVVSGPNGPEAGVWVIAETTELPTRFARIVVTDEQYKEELAKRRAQRTTTTDSRQQQ